MGGEEKLEAAKLAEFLHLKEHTPPVEAPQMRQQKGNLVIWDKGVLN